jgi:hypothetical protein
MLTLIMQPWPAVGMETKSPGQDSQAVRFFCQDRTAKKRQIPIFLKGLLRPQTNINSMIF